MVKRHYGVTTERYKLMHFYYDFDEWEMNDLENDPQEMNNVDDDPKIHLYSTGFKMELFEK